MLKVHTHWCRKSRHIRVEMVLDGLDGSLEHICCHKASKDVGKGE